MFWTPHSTRLVSCGRKLINITHLHIHTHTKFVRLKSVSAQLNSYLWDSVTDDERIVCMHNTTTTTTTVDNYFENTKPHKLLGVVTVWRFGCAQRNLKFAIRPKLCGLKKIRNCPLVITHPSKMRRIGSI
ncbi:hypothetical protein CsSME_00019665 [Camellia sinensis var. sinensis]